MNARITSTVSTRRDSVVAKPKPSKKGKMGVGMSGENKKGEKSAMFGDTVESAIAREMDEQKDRYIPESLDVLIERTHFSKFELKYLYQCFKQNCPSGYVTREQFIAIFRQFFWMHKLSDARPYAELVFNTFDDDGNGRISFSEFAVQLSLFNKGTIDQRLDWLFDLYDGNRRGFITEEDFQRVCQSMYALVGIHYLKEKHIPILLKRHLKHQFGKLDRNKDGRITRAEFIEGCKQDPQICESIERLRTAW